MLLVVGVAWWVGGDLIAPTNHEVTMPADFAAETVSIPGDGHAIAGSWRDFGGDAPIVLLLHGIRADRSSMVTHARLLTRAGFSVLLIDLQAHGETPGSHITLGFREADDVRAALDWLRARAPNRKIGVIGQSLGGAAVLLGKQPLRFDAVVLESVYPRVTRAVENRVRMRLGEATPWVAPLLLAQLKLRVGASAAELEPIRHIPKVSAPVLVVGGMLDEHTTVAETEELYSAAGGEDPRLWIVEGAAHEDLARHDEREYRENVIRFLREYLGEARDPEAVKRIVAEQVAAKPKGPQEPSVAVEFYAEGLHRPVSLELQLIRLGRQCLQKFGAQCGLSHDPPLSVMEGLFALGPPFEATLAGSTVKEYDTIEALERETAEVAKTFESETAAYDRQMFVRLMAASIACRAEHDADFRAALGGIVQLNYQRIEQLETDEYDALMESLMSEAEQMGEQLRHQWLSTTCTSAIALRDDLMYAYRAKVRPFGSRNWRKAKAMRQHLSAVSEIAYTLARDVDPTLELRILELRGQVDRIPRPPRPLPPPEPLPPPG